MKVNSFQPVQLWKAKRINEMNEHLSFSVQYAVKSIALLI